MAWQKPYSPQVVPIADGNQAMAVDWDVKKIPGICYKNCMISKENLILARGGLDHTLRAFIKFVAALDGFYTSVDTEFNKYLKTDAYKKQNLKYKVDDYLSLASLTPQSYELKYFDVLEMFTILREWCFTKGPFRVYNDVEPEAQNVFDKIDDQYQ